MGQREVTNTRRAGQGSNMKIHDVVGPVGLKLKKIDGWMV